MAKLILSGEKSADSAVPTLASRRAKVVLAGIVLAAGIFVAFQFRKPHRAKTAIPTAAASPAVNSTATNSTFADSTTPAQDPSSSPSGATPAGRPGPDSSPPLDLFSTAKPANSPPTDSATRPASPPGNNAAMAQSEPTPAAGQVSAAPAKPRPTEIAEANEFHTAAGTVTEKPTDAAVPDLPSKFGPPDPPSQATQSDAHCEPAASGTPPKIHRVVDGDSLALLAERFLGSAARANEIFACNRDVLSDPELLPIGARLRIPAGPAPAQSATADAMPSSPPTSTNSQVQPVARPPAAPPTAAIPAPTSQGDGGATISGIAPPQPPASPVSKTPLLDIGASGLSPLPPTNAQSAVAGKIYIVQTGDTLSGIAQKVYGDPSRTDALLQANREQIRGEPDLRPGMILETP